MMKTILTVCIAELLAARALAAPVVSPATGPLKETVIASASIGGDGTILRQDGHWLSQVSFAELPAFTFPPLHIQFTLTSNPPVFTSPPTCVATLALPPDDVGILFDSPRVEENPAIDVSGTGTGSILVDTVVTYTTGPEGPQNIMGLPFNLICEGDYTLSVPIGGPHFPFPPPGLGD